MLEFLFTYSYTLIKNRENNILVFLSNLNISY